MRIELGRTERIIYCVIAVALTALMGCKKSGPGIMLTIKDGLTNEPMAGIKVKLLLVRDYELELKGPGPGIGWQRTLETGTTDEQGMIHFKRSRKKDYMVHISAGDIPPFYWNRQGAGYSYHPEQSDLYLSLFPVSILVLRCVNVSPYNPFDQIIVDGAASYRGTQIDETSYLELFGGYQDTIRWSVIRNGTVTKKDTVIYLPPKDTAWLTIHY